MRNGEHVRSGWDKVSERGKETWGAEGALWSFGADIRSGGCRPVYRKTVRLCTPSKGFSGQIPRKMQYSDTESYVVGKISSIFVKIRACRQLPSRTSGEKGGVIKAFYGVWLEGDFRFSGRQSAHLKSPAQSFATM